VSFFTLEAEKFGFAESVVGEVAVFAVRMGVDDFLEVLEVALSIRMKS
jgi:hypothetical protein